jgi:lysophospholipase L1-like esterase
MAKSRERSSGNRAANVGLVVLAVVTAALVAFALKPVAPATTSTATSAVYVKPTRLLAFGHSIPLGRGASSPSRGYVALVGAYLHVPVANYAVGGAEMTDTLAIVEAKPAPLPTDLVILHIGLNDIELRGMNPSLESDGAAVMNQMLGKLTSQGARVVVMSECEPVNWSTPAPFNNGSDAAFAAWNAVVAKAASGYINTTLVKACTTWDPATNVDGSGYHPNDAGHALIATAIEKAVAHS